MGKKDKKSKEEAYKNALQGKKIPILTLDNKWHQLFTQTKTMPEIKRLSDELNELLKKQGKLNTDIKGIRNLKKKLMDEIVTLRDEAIQTNHSDIEDKIDQHKKLIQDCNDKLDAYQDELLDLPTEIEQINFRLMVLSMEACYERIAVNEADIQEISEWISEVRIELKKKLIRKQEMEQDNHELYSYMHDIFGADVVDLFDLHMRLEKNDN
ncbi:MAG: hypothetical protein IJW63_12240 [Lachnospiraceae bacterium]|nr:hypothetical protein [Lachnospiraceae bacterium]MBQ7360846.1 hypothetical protein [Lachnospiraceae bacterium]